MAIQDVNADTDSDVFNADAGEGDAVDSPVDEEQTEEEQNAEGQEQDEEQAADDEGASEEEEDAAPADPQRKRMKPAQSKQSPKDDHIAAAARKDAERQVKEAQRALQAERESKDAIARRYGHKDWDAFERYEAAQAMIQNGVPEAAAQRMAEQDSRLKMLENERAQTAAEKAQQKLWHDLLDAYPGLNPDEMPAEVFEAVDKGETPLNAYRAYDNKQLRAKLAALQHNKKIKDKAPGSAKGVKSAPSKRDPFLAGLGQ